MNKIEGIEWCPYCECETDFNVEEDVWIIKCSHCGRPLMLCDKCYSMYGSQGRTCVSGCKECTHCEETSKELDKLLKKWENEQVGKRVHWSDPDNGICSCDAVVVSVDDTTWTLKNEKGSIIEALEDEFEFV